MSETKTYCIGRFLIDVPKEAEINGQGYDFMYQIDSTKTDISEKDFIVQMAKREVELKAINENTGHTLKDIFTPIPTAKLFLVSEIVYGDDDYGFEAYKLNNGRLFTLKKNNFDEDILRSKVLPPLQKDLLSNLRTRQPDEIPTEPGFCLENGFVADDGSNNRFEEAQIGFLFNAHPGLLINFVTKKNGDKSEGPLLKRVEESTAKMNLDRSSIRTLRKGVRQVGQFSGEELLDTLPDDNGVKVLLFRWESPGLPNDVYAPNIYVDMSTGQLSGAYTHPTITDAHALTLFDSIVNSIRLRPTGPVKVSIAEPPPLPPIGTARVTGEICPQSGWWQCEDGIDYSYISIEGGRQQFFHAGQIMPQAVLLGMPTFWQRFFEGKKSFRQPATTVWKLNAYDDATINLLA